MAAHRQQPALQHLAHLRQDLVQHLGASVLQHQQQGLDHNHSEAALVAVQLLERQRLAQQSWRDLAESQHLHRQINQQFKGN
jgi:hypothetical protein